MAVCRFLGGPFLSSGVTTLVLLIRTTAALKKKADMFAFNAN